MALIGHRICSVHDGYVHAVLYNVPTGITGWDWMWIALGVMLDIMKWSSMIKYRRENEYYPETMP